jgi:hypothetical protein
MSFDSACGIINHLQNWPVSMPNQIYIWFYAKDYGFKGRYRDKLRHRGVSGKLIMNVVASIMGYSMR